MGNLRRLQDALKKLWTDERYSEQFRHSPSPYKDFDHALKHIRKAAQVLENMTEEADHSGVSCLDRASIGKYAADIVISALRLANVSPTGDVDLEAAVADRIERKMGARVEMEADAEEKRLNQKIGQLRTALWNEVKVWNDPSDRNYTLCRLCGSHEFNGHKPQCVLA